jgi:hypothetical protein
VDSNGVTNGPPPVQSTAGGDGDVPRRGSGGGAAARPLLAAGALVSIVFLVQMAAALRERWIVPPPLDDAYAFCRYADHLLSGWGLSWNPGGPQTYGCTSLLYALWIAALRGITGLVCWRSLGLGAWLPALLAVFVMGMACSRAASSARMRHWLVALGFVCLCVCVQKGISVQGGFFFHAKSGMDTTTAILTNSLLVWAALDPRLSGSLKRVAVVACVSYLSFLARPDNLLYALLFPGLFLALHPVGGPQRLRFLGCFLGVLVFLLAVDTAVKSIVFGDPLPLPYYAKRGAYYEGYVGAMQWNPAVYSWQFLSYQLVPVATLVLTANLRCWRLLVAGLVPCVLTFGYFATVTQIMGYQARFYFPALPFLAVMSYQALDTRIGAANAGAWPRIMVSLAVRGVLLGGVVVAGSIVKDEAASRYEDHCRRLNPNLMEPSPFRPAGTAEPLGWGPSAEAVARMVQACPEQTVWAMSEHGYVSAAAPQVRIIDLAGLHDRNTLTGKPIVEHVLEQEPDVIWFPHRDYTGLVNGLQTSRAFGRAYDYWPGAFDYGLAVRKDSEQRREILRVVREVWRDCYGKDFPIPSIRLRTTESSAASIGEAVRPARPVRRSHGGAADE